jgi:hypothetical protein
MDRDERMKNYKFDVDESDLRVLKSNEKGFELVKSMLSLTPISRKNFID